MNKIKVNLGSGPGKIADPTWQHYDASKRLLLLKSVPFIGLLKIGESKLNTSNWDLNTQYENINKLKFRNESIDYIYSSHSLEHLYLNDAKALLRKTHAWLKPGGIMRLALPDYDKIYDEFRLARQHEPLFAYEKLADRLGTYPLTNPGGPIKNFIGELIGKNLHSHKWHPHADYMTALLQSYGFTSVELRQHKESLIPHIETIESREKDTFFIDAVK